MVAVVACISQKGGVAKSALARLVAREYAVRGRKVMLADLDTYQSTATEWAARRRASQTAPIFPVQEFESVKRRSRPVPAMIF
jgi:chromosome partitioning protein